MMKKLLVAAALGVASFSVSQTALATAPASELGLAHQGQPAWICGLSFQGEAEGAQIIVGDFEAKAHGRIKCVGLNGEKYEQKVRVTIGSDPIEAAIAFGDFEFAGRSAEISLFNCAPKALFGSYLIAEGQAAFGIGAGAFVATKISPPEIAVQVSVQLLSGFGIDLGLYRMRIEPM
jgi:ABC-type glycerol-3-phosphate transport system substrate-binding protein